VLKKHNNILLLLSIILFIIIYPYTKTVTVFRAEDTSWDVLNQTRKYKQFDARTFTLIQSFDFTKEVLEMDGKTISIKGFLKKHKHGNHTDIIITETVTDVCFMCNHDEHYNMITLNLTSKKSELYHLDDDAYVKVEGIFKLNKNKNAHSVYELNSTELKEVINGN